MRQIDARFLAVVGAGPVGFGIMRLGELARQCDSRADVGLHRPQQLPEIA